MGSKSIELGQEAWRAPQTDNPLGWTTPPFGGEAAGGKSLIFFIPNSRTVVPTLE